MPTITKFFAALAGLIHVLFCLMESFFWSNPAIHGIFKVTSTADAETINVFIKNQGYYNLFLALGIFAGLALVRRNQIVGQTLVIYTSMVMIGAAIVLLFTVPAMKLGVLIQGLPPMIALAALLLGRKKEKVTAIR